MNSNINIDTEVQYLKGVGPKLAALLNNKGVTTVRDLLYYFPRDYQDRSKIAKISDLNAHLGDTLLLSGQIINFRYLNIRSLRRPILEAKFQDSSGTIYLKWFHYNKGYFESKFKECPTVLAFGKISRYGSTFEIIHPELDWDADATLDASRDAAKGAGVGYVPVYSESEGLNQRFLRKITEQALDVGLSQVEENLPKHILEKHKLISLSKAVGLIHHPTTENSLEDLRGFKTAQQRRFIFDEFFKFEWVIGRKRHQVKKEITTVFPKEDALVAFRNLEKELSFELTKDQKSAISKIFDDLSSENPMSRLLQGDVGCGKTVVSFSAILPVVIKGFQAALMVPTEILAQQHFNSAKNIFKNFRFLDCNQESKTINIEILVGSTTKAKKAEISQALLEGKIDLLIGTHALIEDIVQFARLGLIIIDEQHRFGVDQRMALRNKGKNPHVLLMTATPIPRTLALTAYGDLDVTIIRELPKGRPEVFTKLVKPKQKTAAIDLIKDEIKKGSQAYVIFPLVEESEKIDLANAVHGAEELANGPLQGFRVGLLHGRMKAQEKAEVMQKFKEGKIHVLVSTTVVEVGVDVPNATVLMIENAERFGLSQLHQLRGRIGRGTQTSHCLLCSGTSSEAAFERLKAMEDTRDGFKLAEIDLEIRGPGDFLGTRQSGDLQFKYGSLIRDQEILMEARDAAFELLKNDPNLDDPSNQPLRRYMKSTGQFQEMRFETA